MILKTSGFLSFISDGFTRFRDRSKSNQEKFNHANFTMEVFMCISPIVRPNERSGLLQSLLLCFLGLVSMPMSVVYAGIAGDIMEYQIARSQIKDAEKLTENMIASYSAVVQIPWEYSLVKSNKISEIALDDQIEFSLDQIFLDLSTFESLENIAIEEISWILRRDLVYDQNHRGQMMSTEFARPHKVHIPVQSLRAVPRQGVAQLDAPFKIIVKGDQLHTIITEFNRQTRNNYGDHKYNITDNPFLRLIVTAGQERYLLGIPIQIVNTDSPETWPTDTLTHRPKHYALGTTVHRKGSLNPYLPNKQVDFNRFVATYNDIVWSKRIEKALIAMRDNWKDAAYVLRKDFKHDQISSAEINTGTIQQLRDYHRYICAYRTLSTPTRVLPREICVGTTELSTDIDDLRLAFTAWQNFLTDVGQLLQNLENTYAQDAKTAELVPAWAGQLRSTRQVISNIQSTLFEINQSWVVVENEHI